MKRPSRKRRQNSAFTLVEVMITMFLISMMCLSVFAGLQQITKTALSVAIRDEAYHLMQDKAEQLLSVPFANFDAAADETIVSSVKASYVPDMKIDALALPADNDNKTPRVSFTRSVTKVASTNMPASTTLRVQVTWTWPKQDAQRRTYVVSTLLYRTP